MPHTTAPQFFDSTIDLNYMILDTSKPFTNGKLSLLPRKPLKISQKSIDTQITIIQNKQSSCLYSFPCFPRKKSRKILRFYWHTLYISKPIAHNEYFVFKHHKLMTWPRCLLIFHSLSLMSMIYIIIYQYSF